MSWFPTPNVFLAIGPIQITWYALCILTGAFCTYMLSQRTVQKWGYSENLIEDFFIPTFGVAILGARIYYVIFQWSYYRQYPQEIVKIWHGGLAVHGGLIAGLLFAVFYFRKRNVSFLRMVDAILPHVLIGQAFGRWGNFFNQEAYGNIVGESFYQYFPSFIKDRMFIDGFYRQPTFLFESIGNVIGWILIVFVFRKKFYRKHGDCGWAYFIWYGILRFGIESLRSDSLMLGPLKMAQVISLLFVLVGLLGYKGLFHRYRKPVLCFGCQKQPIHTIQLLKENGYATVLVDSDASMSQIVQSVDDMEQGHDDCILISDMVKVIEQGKKIGVYTMLVGSDETDIASENVESYEDLYYKVQEEKSWSDNTIW